LTGWRGVKRGTCVIGEPKARYVGQGVRGGGAWPGDGPVGGRRGAASLLRQIGKAGGRKTGQDNNAPAGRRVWNEMVVSRKKYAAETPVDHWESGRSKRGAFRGV
jgi:hypothetical protein